MRTRSLAVALLSIGVFFAPASWLGSSQAQVTVTSGTSDWLVSTASGNPPVPPVTNSNPVTLTVKGTGFNTTASQNTATFTGWVNNLAITSANGTSSATYDSFGNITSYTAYPTTATATALTFTVTSFPSYNWLTGSTSTGGASVKVVVTNLGTSQSSASTEIYAASATSTAVATPNVGTGATINITGVNSSGGITSFTVNQGGSGYPASDTSVNTPIGLFVTGGGGSGGVVRVDTTAGGAAATTSYTVGTAGSGYSVTTGASTASLLVGTGSNSLSWVPYINSTAQFIYRNTQNSMYIDPLFGTIVTGSGCTLNITAPSGTITAATVNNGGSNYAAYPAFNSTFNLKLTSGGGSGGIINVTTNASGVVTTVNSIVNGGTGYSTTTGATTFAFTTGNPLKSSALGAHPVDSFVDNGTDSGINSAPVAGVTYYYWISQYDGNLRSLPYSYTGTVSSTGAPYYAVPTIFTTTATVNPAPITITANQSYNYGSSPPTFGSGSTAFSITSGSLQNGDSISSVTLAVSGGTPSATSPVNSTFALNPSAAVVASGNGSSNPAANYTFTYVPGTLTVSPLPVVITASPQTYVSGTNPPAFGSGSTAFSANPSSLPNGDSISSVTLAVSGGPSSTSPVGSTFTITPSLAQVSPSSSQNNYTFTYNTGTLTVGAAPTTPITITATNQSYNYGTNPPAFGSGSTAFSITSGSLQNGDTISSVTLAVSGSPSSTSAVGTTFTITPSLAQVSPSSNQNNYAFTYNTGTLTVNAAPTPTITPNTNYLVAGTTTLTINGTNFSPILGNNSIEFSGPGADGIEGNLSQVNAQGTQLTYNISAFPTTNGILQAAVTVAGAAASSSTATVATSVPTPTITGNTNAFPSTSTALIILGTGFSTTASQNSVTFSGPPAVSPFSVNNGATANGGFVNVVPASVNAAGTQLTFNIYSMPTTTGHLSATVTTNGLVTSAAQAVTAIDQAGVPTSLSAQAGINQVLVTWYRGAAADLKQVLYRNTTNSMTINPATGQIAGGVPGNPVVVATISLSANTYFSYNDTTATASGGPYYYWVSSYDSANTVPYSSSGSTTSTPTPVGTSAATGFPATPVNGALTSAVTSSQIALSWTPPAITDPNATVSYYVFRTPYNTSGSTATLPTASPAPANFAATVGSAGYIASASATNGSFVIGANSCTFTDTAVVNGASYSYAIATVTTNTQTAASSYLITYFNGGSGVPGNASTFTMPAAITSISPNSGPITGNTAVTITGAGLSGATAVYFGTTAAASFTVNSNNSITAITPAASAGPVNIIITVSGLQSSLTSGDEFTFQLYFNYSWTTWQSLNWSTPAGSTITWNSQTIPVAFSVSSGFYSWYAPANAQTVNQANGAISGTAWGIASAPYPWSSSSLTTNIAGTPGMDGPYADPSGNMGNILYGDWKDFATGQLSYYGPYSNGTAWNNPVFWSYYNLLVQYNQLPSQYSVTATTTTVTNNTGYQYFLASDGLPSSPLGRTSYVGNSGMYYFNTDPSNTANAKYSNGPFFQDSHTKLTDITDGTSNTLMFGESLGGPDNALPTYQLTWMGTGTMPSNWDCQTPSQYFMFSSMHPGVVNFAFCDGSVRSVSKVTASNPPDSMGTQTGTNTGDGTNTNSDSARPPAASNPPTPRWIAFQLLAGINDNSSPDFTLLGLTP
jgi:prepilin-type processing-associated H-X9-DG protein